MSYTTADAVNFVTNYLKASLDIDGVNTLRLTGGIYPYQRPKDSSSEDIVVNSLVMGREPVQSGVLNVNLFINNELHTKPTGEEDRSRPDLDRMRQLGKPIGESLENYWNEEGSMTLNVVQDSVFPDLNNQHYINFRVEFKALNI